MLLFSQEIFTVYLAERFLLFIFNCFDGNVFVQYLKKLIVILEAKMLISPCFNVSKSVSIAFSINDA